MQKTNLALPYLKSFFSPLYSMSHSKITEHFGGDIAILCSDNGELNQ